MLEGWVFKMKHGQITDTVMDGFCEQRLWGKRVSGIEIVLFDYSKFKR